ncbi:MAG TPA: ComF family protein [Bacteroidales bacterium]|nr:ComF family protein [Bacteroidales bacterium]
MTLIKDIAGDFLGLFFPELCLSCHAPLMRGEKILCTHCLVAVKRTDFHLRRDNSLEQVFWGRCLVERAAAFSVYNRGSRVRTLIHLMKYKGRKDLGRALGNLYGSYLKDSDFMNGIDLLIPVPLHPSRLRKRGYNQSDYIARGLSEVTGVPVLSDLLKRAVQGSSQTKRGRYERWENVEGMFIVTKPDRISGKHLLVVDDVITTGSTMEACVNALHDAAEVRVSVIALAAAQKLTV